MKVFIYKSKEDLIEGIRVSKKLKRKKWKLYAIERPFKNLRGIEDFEGDYFWAIPIKLADKLELEVEKGMGKLAYKLSTKSRKK